MAFNRRNGCLPCAVNRGRTQKVYDWKWLSGIYRMAVIKFLRRCVRIARCVSMKILMFFYTLVRRPIESSCSIIQIRYAGRLCYIRTSIVVDKKRAARASPSRPLINIGSSHARRLAREQMEIFKCQYFWWLRWQLLYDRSLEPMQRRYTRISGVYILRLLLLLLLKCLFTRLHIEMLGLLLFISITRGHRYVESYIRLNKVRFY